MTTKEFNKKIESGEAKVLTVEAAKALEGQDIYYTYFGYNRQNIAKITVAKIQTEMEAYENDHSVEGYASRAEYWRKNLDPKRVKELEATLVLPDELGSYTLRAYYNNPEYQEPTFTCSDSDREVYYLPYQG